MPRYYDGERWISMDDQEGSGYWSASIDANGEEVRQFIRQQAPGDFWDTGDFSGGYQPWDWQSVYGGMNPQGYSFQNLYGGTQYGHGVTSYSHIDPAQYQANQYANETREKLWNYYNSLPASSRPALNPDQFAKQKMAGARPGTNTLALQNQLASEYIPGYQSSYTQDQINQFGQQIGSGVGTQQIFAQQQAPKEDKLGGLVKMGLLGLAGAGLTGMLPGTENVFSGLFGGSGAADAAWGVNAAGGAGPTVTNAALLGGAGPTLEAAAAAGGAGLGGAGSSIGSNMGFFSDILGNGFTDIFSSGAIDSGGIMTGAFGDPIVSGGQMGLGIGGEAPWWESIPSATSQWFDIPTTTGGESFLGGLSMNDVLSGAKSLWGGVQGLGGMLGGAQNVGSLLGGDSIFGKVASAAPSIAALAYANNQGDFDTSRLESLYGAYNPEASAFEYDQNTATGRQRLNDSLTNRGVSGSSFGNYDINSFNTNRELGREALINQSVGNSANIANMILNADIKNRAIKNDLIGRALSGVGGSLASKSVFGS